MKKTLVDTQLYELIKSKNIEHIDKLDLKNYVESAGIDIPLGSTGYITKQKFLPFNKKIKDIIEKVSLKKINLEKKCLFLKGQTYLVRCLKINVPKNLNIICSPKSSIGRIDVLVRAISDFNGLYDSISENSKGEVWLEITPQSFNIEVKKGIALTQFRFFENSNEKRMPKRYDYLINDKGKQLKNFIEIEGSIFLRLNLDSKKFVGFKALATNEIIDLEKINHHKAQLFFKKIKTNIDKSLTLEKDKFYILYTKEKISVPKEVSIEMLPFSHKVGELRAHYAGFFDPGFGFGKGASGVLEVRPYENLKVYDGQPFVAIKIFQNKSIPKTLYSEKKNNYQNQSGPKLAKYFKE